MTREEAIHRIENHIRIHSKQEPFRACHIQEALEMAIDVLKAQDQGNSIPIDWLMSYAQLPTEYAIAEWRKPKKEALIKQIKSGDKPMSFDDALRLVNDQREATPWNVQK